MLQGIKLSKTQNPTTAENRKRMKAIPYASAICSMMYTRPIVYLAMSLAKGYYSDPGVDHSLLQDAANVTLRSETLRETVCDAMITNGTI